MVAARRGFDEPSSAGQEALLRAARATDAASITDERLAGLPDPVERYLRHAGVVGRTIPRTVHLTQRGGMHPSANGPWLPLTATQVYSVDPPGFVWAATVRVGPLPVIRGCDSLVEGKGHMDIRVGSLVPLVDETGPEMDEASLLRHLSEMIWFPMAFLAPSVSFEAIDEHHAGVSIVDGDRRASGTMTFDDEGRLLDFVALRHRLVEGAHVPTTWSTPMTEYGELAGLRLPVRGKAVWKLPEGDLEYIDVEITGLRFDAPATGGA
jgi:hypothetical protein